MEIRKFEKLPILGIVRGIAPKDAEGLIDAAISSGLETLEITMNTPGAPDIIKRCVKRASGRITLGAGTVLTKDALKSALDSGASFIVMPTLVKEVVEHCVKNKIPNFPGALTPQEIYDAWNAGATMVKVFPSGFFGPKYFSEIKGPFNDIKLLACGGVTPANMKEYFSSGADAVSFGASVFKKEYFASGDMNSISSAIKKFISAYRTDVTDKVLR